MHIVCNRVLTQVNIKPNSPGQERRHSLTNLCQFAILTFEMHQKQCWLVAVVLAVVLVFSSCVQPARPTPVPPTVPAPLMPQAPSETSPPTPAPTPSPTPTAPAPASSAFDSIILQEGNSSPKFLLQHRQSKELPDNRMGDFVSLKNFDESGASYYINQITSLGYKWVFLSID